jgi:hypothetical protein
MEARKPVCKAGFYDRGRLAKKYLETSSAAADRGLRSAGSAVYVEIHEESGHRKDAPALVGLPAGAQEF